MRIRLIGEGKTKGLQLRALEADYKARIERFTDVVVEEAPPDRAATGSSRGGSGEKVSSAERRLLEKVSGSYKVFLDAGGREWTSEEFARWLGGQALRGTRELAFLVGGPQGFSAAFKKQADLLLALSRMTLTRDWARALLLEQIYRGFTILRGYPYAK
ncbi:MAG: 23S rRNA (pseudouridine(1915)-N(3))-methyltransferase RlmH [Acidobacteria bacterium]|nr:MAG: 23S rRNA (pseudouridine(1915)-N(3))-methyltransferase RlmH [Acidobacteriota bacterium]PYV23351.1 MAG: 23S rRNA (pseudouridine(1915)-N(3))-methyltransferase RlmH [Acidobacteriota bacterium]